MFRVPPQRVLLSGGSYQVLSIGLVSPGPGLFAPAVPGAWRKSLLHLLTFGPRLGDAGATCGITTTVAMASSRASSAHAARAAASALASMLANALEDYLGTNTMTDVLARGP